MSKLTSLAAVGALVALVSLPAAPAAAQSVWKGFTFMSASNHPDYKHLEKLAKEFTELSGGQVQTKTNVGGSLPIPTTAITQAVGEGTLTFAHDGYYTGNVPIGALTMLPMLMSLHQEFEKAVKVFEPYLAAELDKKGVTLLATFNFPIQTIWGVSPITSLADLKGKKIRVGNLPTAEFIRRLGGVPITLATPDVAPALERSTIDGLITASAGGGRLWGDMLKYNFRLPLHYDLFLYIANKKAFERLSPDLQQKFREAARRDAAELSRELAESEEEVTQQLKAKGLVVTVPDPAVHAEATKQYQDYWEQWAKSTSPNAVKALAEIRAAIGK